MCVGKDAVETRTGLTVVVAEAEAATAVTAVAVTESLATACVAVAVAVAAVATLDEVATASEAAEAEAVVVSVVEPVAPPVALPLPLQVEVRPKAASSWIRNVSDHDFAVFRVNKAGRLTPESQASAYVWFSPSVPAESWASIPDLTVSHCLISTRRDLAAGHTRAHGRGMSKSLFTFALDATHRVACGGGLGTSVDKRVAHELRDDRGVERRAVVEVGQVSLQVVSVSVDGGMLRGAGTQEAGKWSSTQHTLRTGSKLNCVAVRPGRPAAKVMLKSVHGPTSIPDVFVAACSRLASADHHLRPRLRAPERSKGPSR